MNHKIEKGKKGEFLAYNFLLAQGHAILAKNFRIRQGEIDIISVWGNTIFFSEVKNWNANSKIKPMEIFTKTKRDRMRLVGEVYLAEMVPGSNISVSFNLITINQLDEIDFYTDLF